MRTRYAIAAFAALVFLLIAGVAVWRWRETESVESSARECEPLIEALSKLKTELGSYPVPTSTALPAHLVARCQYQPIGDGYVLVLSGSKFNLQAYEYNSTTQTWQWD